MAARAAAAARLALLMRSDRNRFRSSSWACNSALACIDMRSRSKGPAPGEEDGADGEARAPELRLSKSGSLQNKHSYVLVAFMQITLGLQAVMLTGMCSIAKSTTWNMQHSSASGLNLPFNTWVTISVSNLCFWCQTHQTKPHQTKQFCL